MARDLSRAVGSTSPLRQPLPTGAHADQLDAALIQAAAMSQVEAIELLIDHGADPSARHAFGRTALFYTPRFELLDTLIRRGAKVALEATGETALEHFLARPRSGGRLPDDALRIVERFLEAGALDHVLDPRRRALVLASACGVPSILELFLRLGVSPHARGPGRDLLEEMKYSPHRAEVFSMLVKAGIAPNTRSETTTLLIEVCREGDVTTAKALLDAGAEVNPALRTTPLSIAEEKGHLVLVDLLLERGARAPGRVFDLETSLALDRAERNAREHATDGSARLEWARLLMANGFRAAGTAEWFAAGRLGVTDTSLPAPPVVENGTQWRFLPFEPEPDGVMGRLDDARVPGARVSDGTRTLPLAVVLGPACTHCDERGQETCSICDGSGSTSSMFSDDDVPCDERQLCSRCAGFKFVVASTRASRGGCRHVFLHEGGTEVRAFERCQKCHLARLSFGTSRGTREELACAVCSRFVCECVKQ